MFLSEFKNEFQVKSYEHNGSLILGFSGLCFLDDFNNNAHQNMGRLSSFGVSP